MRAEAEPKSVRPELERRSMQSEEEPSALPSVWTPASYGGLVQACPAPTSTTTTPSVTTAYPGHLDECCCHARWMNRPHLADANATCTQPLAVTPGSARLNLGSRPLPPTVPAPVAFHFFLFILLRIYYYFILALGHLQASYFYWISPSGFFSILNVI